MREGESRKKKKSRRIQGKNMLVETGSKESWMQSGDPRGVLCLAAKGEAAVWCRGTSLALGHCKTSDASHLISLERCG